MNREKIQFDSWAEVEEWTNNTYYIPAGYLSRCVDDRYPRDAFSLGQIASKAWLLSRLSSVCTVDSCYILGCWFGQLAPLLILGSLVRKQVIGFDLSPESIRLSEDFCQPWIQKNWQFKGVVEDVNNMDWGDPSFVIDGELINATADLIINTSTEHMSDEWFNMVRNDQMVLLQGNSNPEFDGHINTAPTLTEWANRYRLNKTYFIGELSLPSYTRYMIIGQK